MSEEQLNAFLEKVKTDTELQDKLKAAASPEAAIEIAKAAGFSITAEDIQSMQSATVELSDEELEGAAGGKGSPCSWGFFQLTVVRQILDAAVSKPTPSKPLHWQGFLLLQLSD